jgi:hypothetical protein
MEIEENDELPFLDLMLKRGKNSKIEIDIYRKPTHTNRFITRDSYCPTSHKMAAFHSMTYRLCKLPLSVKNFMKELNYIKTAAKVNGYSENIVDNLVNKHSKSIKKQNLSTFFTIQKQPTRRICFNYAAPLTNRLKEVYKNHNIELVFASENKLKNSLTSTKPKIENVDKSGIYEIKCKLCNKIYIGQTRRKISTRYKEHCAHIRYNRPEKSALAKHILNDFHANLNDLEIKLKKSVNKTYKLDAWESFYMHKNKSKTVNTDPPPIISPLFNF